MAGFGELGEDGGAIVDDAPVGGINAVLAVGGRGDLDDVDAGLLEAFDDSSVFLAGFGVVDGAVGIIGVDVVVVGEVVGAGD